MRKSRVLAITFAFAALITSSSYVAFGQRYGELTVTEDLIRREIMRLGGDWESGDKPVLVSFLGDRFESRHFEMLTNLPTVQYFHAQDCRIDHFALACLSQVRQLERIDVNGCQLDSECVSLLRGNRELREMHFESIALSDHLLTEVARLKQIKTIVLIDCEGMTKERLSTLTAALPGVVIKTALPKKALLPK